MKKFLALMFVCAGLTAMAAPHVNKAEVAQAPKGQMVMKSNTLTNHLTAGVSQSFMQAAKKNVQRTSSQNLVNQRAPRRLSADEIVSKPYVCFLYAASYDDNGNYVNADPYYAGSGAYWNPNTSNGLSFAGFYWDAEGSTYYLPLSVDFTTNEVSLGWGILLESDTTSDNPGARLRTDTIRWHAILSEDYYKNQAQNDCKGTLYPDGSIIFDDNYVYYRETTIEEYQNNEVVSSNSTEEVTVFIGTEILAANGNLTYVRERDNAADNSYVYMFQNEANDSLFVGNMWNYGVPNVALTISPEAKANYNCIAEVGEDSTIYLGNPIWDIDDSWITGGLGMCYGVGGYTTTDDGHIDELIWGFEGDVTPEQITWDYTAASNGYHLFWGYNNNVLTWINGGTFGLPVAPGPDFIRGDVDRNGEVTIADVSVLIDHLLTQDFDDADDFSSDAADCDVDGGVSISDVSKLIDYILTKTWD